MSADNPDGAPARGAYLHWDDEWRREAVIADWSTPEPWVVSVLRTLRGPDTRRSLDLGCGMGRHALEFGKEGLESYALDRSESAVAATRERAGQEGLKVDLRVADFTALPYEDGFFDYVLAWNVIYHGTQEEVATAIGEVARVLRPGGVFQSTMLSKRNHEYGKGLETSRDSWVQPQGPEDKAFPHLYSDEHDVLRLHPGFRLLTAFDEAHRDAGSYHWHLVFERTEGP